MFATEIYLKLLSNDQDIQTIYILSEFCNVGLCVYQYDDDKIKHIGYCEERVNTPIIIILKMKIHIIWHGIVV